MSGGGTRREILAALLGLPVAMSCRSRAPAPRFEGGFVDRSLEDGHRIRKDFRPAPPIGEPPRNVSVLVLGAGVSGLTAAWQLVRAGVRDVLVLELEERAGGTSASGRSEISAHPWGAHYLPAPRASNRDLVELLRETGSVIGEERDGEPIYEETHLCAAPKERVFFRGLWHEGLFPRSGAGVGELAQLEAFEREVSSLIGRVDGGGRRAFALPLSASSHDAELAALDRISIAEWLDKRSFDSPMLRWYVEYACRDDFGTELAGTSAWYALHYFAARTLRPGGESAEFLTWPEGNGFLVDHLVKKIEPSKIMPGMMVTSVVPEGAKVKVIAWDRGARRARAFLAERVIFALPSFLRSRVLAEFPGIRKYDVRYSPWLVANIHLAEHPESFGFPEAWDNVIHGSRSLGYVVATHQSGRAAGPTVWTWYLPFTGEREKEERNRLASLSYESAADVVMTELSACHRGIPELVKRIDIMRWGHAMVRPSPGSFSSAEREAAAAPVGPLHFAHTDLSGVALFEEAFHHGTRAAREVLSAFRGG